MRDDEHGTDLSPSAVKIRDTTRAMIEESGFGRVTVAGVARRSGVNEVTIYRIFGSRDGLAAACWSSNVAVLERGIARDRARFHQPIERVGSHLRRLTRVAIADRQVTYAMIQGVESASIETGPTMGALDPRIFVPLPQLCTPLVAAAQEEGTIRVDQPASEIAAFLTNSVLLRLMTRSQHSAAAVSSFVIDLTLEGILTDQR